MRKTRTKIGRDPIELEENPREKVPETPEEWENICILKSYKLAKKHLDEGTATSQEITHFLKLGSTKERLEREMMETQNELMAAKRDQLRSARKMEELLTEAMAAFTEYRGGEG